MADGRAARHEATRRRIIEAAWLLAEERGLGGWALKDVADAVGMRTPSLYVYVESKNDLYDALYADGYRQLLDRIDRLRVPADPAAALGLAARTFVDFCSENGPRYQLLFLRTVPGFEPSQESYALALDVVERTRAVLAAAGAGRPRDVDLFTALVTGLASQQVSNDPGGRRWRRLTDDAVAMFLAARAA
jgi:AcrR family transcriptional regulator